MALLVEILRSLWRGEVGLDIVAALSMTAALAFGETLAAAVVAVMYSGGTFLENFAEGRARREMHDLLSRVPRTATRHRNGGLEDVPLDDIEPGDLLLIRQGDVVPVDGSVASDTAFVDTSALTGESLPAHLSRGADAMSGSTNAGAPFELTATRPARQSTYAGIVRLVEEAQRSKAPMARLADRWSLGFLAVTVVIAFAAWWFTGDPIRAVCGFGRGDALSADFGRAGGAGRRAVTRGSFRCVDQRRGSARDDGADPNPDPRQDRHPDRWASADRFDQQRGRHR